MNEQGSYFQNMRSHKCLHSVIVPGNRQCDYKIISLNSIYKKKTCHFVLGHSVSLLLSPAFLRSMKTGLLQLLHVLPAAAFFLKKFKFIWHAGKAETLLFNSLFFKLPLCNETPEITS